MPESAESEIQLHNAVTRADRARRVRDAARRLWAAAPLAAGACLMVALTGRLRGWTPFVTLLALAAATGALAILTVASRRRRALSDADVAHIDAEAGLRGELRSAHWFMRLPAEASAKPGLPAEASA